MIKEAVSELLHWPYYLLWTFTCHWSFCYLEQSLILLLLLLLSGIKDLEGKIIVDELRQEVISTNSKAEPPHCLCLAWSADGQVHLTTQQLSVPILKVNDKPRWLFPFTFIPDVTWWQSCKYEGYHEMHISAFELQLYDGSFLIVCVFLLPPTDSVCRLHWRPDQSVAGHHWNPIRTCPPRIFK